MAANIIFPDGTTLNISDISANINTYSTQPSTSEGKGEIAYFEDTDSVMVNKGTASSPDWQSMGGGFSGDSNLDMNGYDIDNIDVAMFGTAATYGKYNEALTSLDFQNVGRDGIEIIISDTSDTPISGNEVIINFS